MAKLTHEQLVFIANIIEEGFKNRNPHLIDKITFNLNIRDEAIIINTKEENVEFLKNELKLYVSEYFTYRMPKLLPSLSENTELTPLKNDELVSNLSWPIDLDNRLTGKLVKDDILALIDEQYHAHPLVQELPDQLDKYMTDVASVFEYRAKYIRGNHLPEKFGLGNFIFPVGGEGAGESYKDMKNITPTIFGLMLLSDYHEKKNGEYCLPAFHAANTDILFSKLPLLASGPDIEIFCGLIGEGGIPKQEHEKRMGRWSGHRFGLIFQRKEGKNYIVILDSLADGHEKNYSSMPKTEKQIETLLAAEKDYTFMAETVKQIKEILPADETEITCINTRLQYAPVGCTIFTENFFKHIMRFSPNVFENISNFHFDKDIKERFNPPSSFLSLFQSLTRFKETINANPELGAVKIYGSRHEEKHKDEANEYENLKGNVLRHTKNHPKRGEYNEKPEHYERKYIITILNMLFKMDVSEIRNICDQHNLFMLDRGRLEEISRQQNTHKPGCRL